MNPRTWENLRASMRNRGIPSLDLIAMRPMGGWQQAHFTRTAEQNALAISFIVENVIPLLSRDGQFYFSVNIPQIRGDLRANPILQYLVRRIEKETNFHLFLSDTTYELSGVLYPK